MHEVPTPADPQTAPSGSHEVWSEGDHVWLRFRSEADADAWALDGDERLVESRFEAPAPEETGE